MRRLAWRLVAATLMVAATLPAFAATPAQAADCGDGVMVVVDFHQLGGGLQQVCDVDGAGQVAAALFEANGFALTYVQRQPGFVCRINDVPADDPCVNTPPANAYWGLFWSDGASGWSYATQGAGGLTLQAGDWVGFSWQGTSAKSPPGVAPKAQPSPSASASRRPSGHASSSASPQAAASSTTESPEPSLTSAPSPTRHQHRPSKSASVSGVALPSESSAASPTSAPTGSPGSPENETLPSWAVPAVVILLFGGAGAAAYLRRRRGAHAP